MDFELIPNSNLALLDVNKDDMTLPVTAQGKAVAPGSLLVSSEGGNLGPLGNASDNKRTRTRDTHKEIDDTLSQFTFDSEADQQTVEKAMSEFIDLTVPITYRVKFNFTPEKVMMRISKDRLRRLNKVWEQSEDGLTLLEFTKLMILEVPSLKEEKLEMINALTRLFKQVDINGDQKMQWSEFVQYMIDQVKTESIVATQDVQGHIVSIGEKIRMQQAGRFHKIKRHGRPMDKGRHKRPMMDVIMCPDQRNRTKTVVMHSEENSTTVQWYGLNMKPVTSMEVPVKGKDSKVLCIAHQDISKSLYAFGPQGTDAVYGVLCSDHILYFYIRNRGRIELFHQIETGNVLQNKVWFMPKHKAWLTAGKDFKIRQWNISPIAQKNQMGEPVQLHSDMITDCIEIDNPFCVATCSLDRTIVLYDLKNREALRRFARKHVTGVRKMKYMKNFGGMIISTGFEIFANVWGPQNLFGNAHLGRLKGHKNPICGVDVIQERPFVFTIDNLNEVIVWDIRNFNPIQIVPGPPKNEASSHGILAIRADMLWIYGSRFIIYDRQEVFDESEVEVPDSDEMKVAVSAFHNQFFSTICVQTPQDLKIYSCLDGQLMVMHQSVFNHAHVNCNHIIQDKRHRKAYLASSDGRINVIDIQSGVPLKQCFEDEDTQNALEAKNKQLVKQMNSRVGSSKVANTKKQITNRPQSGDSLGKGKQAAFLTETADAMADTTPQISGQVESDHDDSMEDDGTPNQRHIVDMILVWEKQMNQIIYADKKGYFIYNESDEKKSQQLRSVTGAHKSNISAVKYSYYLSLIATGTENGEVAVWDYELSQLLGMCQGHSQSRGEICAIEFLQPYPVMVTAGLDSKIVLWAVRPAPQKQCYISIGMFYNISFNYTDDSKYPVRSLICLSGDSLKGFSRGVCMKHSQINADIYRDYKTNQALALKETSVRIDNLGQYRGLSQIKDIRLGMLKDQLKANEEGWNKIETAFEEMRLSYLPRMEHMDPEYDAKIEEEKLRVYMYLGDDFGILKQWDLTYLLEKSGLEPCQPFWKTRGDQYFPGRTEMVNVTGYASRLRNIAQSNMQTNFKRVVDPEDSGLIIRECVAHNKAIQKISKHELGGMITISKDCQVRIWSHGLDLWGIIDCRHYEQDVLWYFPSKDKRSQEIHSILQMQELTNQLRESDEQAVLVERDSDLDNEDEENFTSKATYKKDRANVLEKKRIKDKEDAIEQIAIIEERREWNTALAMSKAKPVHELKEFLPFNRNKRTIERVGELIEKGGQLENRILYEEEKTEIKGDIVAETSKRLDKLIYKALKKHERAAAGSESMSPSARKQFNRNYSKGSINMRRSRQMSMGRSDIGSDNSSNKSRSSPKKFSPVRRLKSKLSVSPSMSPSMSPKSPQAKKLFIHGQQPSPLTINVRRMDNKDVSDESPVKLLNLQKIGTSKNNSNLVSKNTSNISLLLDSTSDSNRNESGTNVISANQRKDSIVVIPEELKEGLEKDGDDSSTDYDQARQKQEPNKRPLDQLNQTLTLMKKVEASQGIQKDVKKYVQDKAYVEDAPKDRKHLLKCKNLPSIREQLFSIKSKQQKAHLDPKYNRKTINVGSNIAASISSPYNNSAYQRAAPGGFATLDNMSSSQKQNGNAESRLSIGLSPFAQSGPKKNHEQVMAELSVIARDLEKHNKNRNFDLRARSMLNQEEMDAAEMSINQRLLGPTSKQLIIGHEDISQQSNAETASNQLYDVKQRSNSLMQQLNRGQHSNIDIHNQAAGSADAESVQKQLQDFQSQLLARDSKRHEKIRIRNLANNRTPVNYRRNMSRLKHDASEVRLQNSNSLQRIIPPTNLSEIELPQSVMIYGSQEMPKNGSQLMRNQALGSGHQISIENRNDALALSPGRFDISLELALGGRGSRNAQQNQVNTDILHANRPEMHINEEDNSALSFIKGHATSQVSAAFKQKLLQNHRSGRNEAQTAANSVSIEQTLAHDPSRQYIDVNFSINEQSASKQTKSKTNNRAGNEQSQMFARNQSLSQVSAAMANYSDAQHHEVGQTSLYGEQQSQSQIKRGIGTRNSLPTNSNKQKVAKNSSMLGQSIGRRQNNLKYGSQARNSKDWKEQRRASEQTRMNDVTGLFEQVDLLEVKKNQYLALKQKYSGKDSGIASLVRREAENIQKQRERINELKYFKSMMHKTKQIPKTDNGASKILVNESSVLTATAAAQVGVSNL